MIPKVPCPWLFSHKAKMLNLAEEHGDKDSGCLQVNAISVPFSGVWVCDSWVGLPAPKGDLLRESTHGPVNPVGSASTPSSFRGCGWGREREIFI